MGPWPLGCREATIKRTEKLIADELELLGELVEPAGRQEVSGASESR